MGVVAKRSSMTFYSDSESHYSQRVRIVLAEKGVAVDVVEASEAHPPAELAVPDPGRILHAATVRCCYWRARRT